MRKLEIKVSEWIHRDKEGEDIGFSCLLRGDGKKCCLGFYLLACGVPKERLQGIGAPRGITKDILPEEVRWLVSEKYTENTPEAMELMCANDGRDSYNIHPSLRHMTKVSDRETIKNIFARHDVEVVFVD